MHDDVPEGLRPRIRAARASIRSGSWWADIRHAAAGPADGDWWRVASDVAASTRFPSRSVHE
jgi:hypothetical protein